MGGLLVVFPLLFTLVLGLDGEGGYWDQASSVACMAVVAGVGLVTLSVRSLLSHRGARVVNWTEEWWLPVEAIREVKADDGLYFVTVDGNVRSSCAQPSVLGTLTGYRRAEKLRQTCAGLLQSTSHDGTGSVTRRRRWELLLMFAAVALALWAVYSVAFHFR